VKEHDQPRSYIVRSGNRLYRRNRKHLRHCTETANTGDHNTKWDDLYTPANIPETEPTSDSPQVHQLPSAVSHDAEKTSTKVTPRVNSSAQPTYTKSGRQVIRPKKLDQ